MFLVSTRKYSVLHKENSVKSNKEEEIEENNENSMHHPAYVAISTKLS